jgi:hypothetical protein
MAGLTGDFNLNGKHFRFEILEIHGEDGNEITGSEMEDEQVVQQADKVFYVVTAPDGEEYHRWLAGPYESIYDIEEAIQDEVGSYEDLIS